MDENWLRRRDAFVRQALRRASLRWHERNIAKTAARVERGFYKCAHCSKLFGPKEIHLDHKLPVVPLDNPNPTWDQYIERLLPPAAGFDVLCVGCHSGKTTQENLLRKIKKDAKKKKKELTPRKKSVKIDI